MKSLRLWSRPLISERCCIFTSAAQGQGLCVKLESRGTERGDHASICCKSGKSTPNRHCCYKWWWTWLDLPLVQGRLQAALTSIGVILSQTLYRKICAVLELALLCQDEGNKSEISSQHTAPASAGIAACACQAPGYSNYSSGGTKCRRILCDRKSSAGEGLPWLWGVHLSISPGKYTGANAEAARQLNPRLRVFTFDGVTQ